VQESSLMDITSNTYEIPALEHHNEDPEESIDPVATIPFPHNYPSYSQETPLLDISFRLGDDARDNGLYEGLSSEERGGLMINI
jgi:hypothetical protein